MYKRTRQALALFMLTFICLRPFAAIAQEIWFGPRLPRAPWIHVQGIVEWPDMFASRSGWETSSTRVAVLKLEPGYIADASDEELTTLSSRLTKLGIAVGIEIQPVAARKSDHCGVTEGYDDPVAVARIVAKLTRLQIRPKYIALDEPVWFGHYADGPQECHFSITDVAHRAAEIAQLYLTAFPQVILGDIEPVGSLVQKVDWQASYRTFEEEFNKALGRKLQFMQLDVDFRNPGWPRQIKAIFAFGRSLGMRMGIIYNGDGEDANDRAWIAHAEQSIALTESLYSIIPDQAIFQSWNKFPTHALPETSPSAHTWLIARYILPRTHFAFHRQGNDVEGRLLATDGHGIANARISIATMGTPIGELPQARTATGVVPDRARFALLGLRVNIECFCNGLNDLMIGKFTYTEHGAGSKSASFNTASEAARSQASRPDGLPVEVVKIGGDLLAHIKIKPNQRLLLNSQIFPVTPLSQFTFSAQIGSVTGNGMFGTATVIWFDADKHDFLRTNVRLERDVHHVEFLRTDATGRFRIVRKGGSGSVPAALQLHFPGNEEFRESYAELP